MEARACSFEINVCADEDEDTKLMIIQ